ncbi:hypothetical protein MZM54_03105 [[Brevibacterium] frigoritolerans]|nr:hypothetical protein [Peribacillus frigoritolerans]
MIEFKNEIAEVRIGFGYGIEFVVPILAKIGCSEENLKAAAIEHFRKYMPTKQEIESVEDLLLTGKAYIRVEHKLELQKNEETT